MLCDIHIVVLRCLNFVSSYCNSFPTVQHFDICMSYRVAYTMSNNYMSIIRVMDLSYELIIPCERPTCNCSHHVCNRPFPGCTESVYIILKFT